MNNIQKSFKAKSALRAADGGHVRGRGGPTDDEVGPVALSNGEYVLPADTVKAIGRKNLDKLRLATHEFVESPEDEAEPRGMANGGEVTNPFTRKAIEDAVKLPAGSARNAALRSGGIEAFDSGARGVAQRVGRFLTSSQSSGATLNPLGTSATREATLSRLSPLRATINQGGGRLGGFARGGLPVAAISGAADSFSDLKSGYRDKFNESIGATGPVSSVAGDVARVLGNVGNAITFGLAGRLGRGLAERTGGGSFTEWFLSESDRDKFNRERQSSPASQADVRAAGAPAAPNAAGDVQTSSAPPAALVESGGLQSRRLAELGIPIDQQNSAPVTDGSRRSLLRDGRLAPGQVVNLGSSGGNANIFGSASGADNGRIDTFTGVGPQAGTAPQEDPLTSEFRSALRSLTNGQRGGGGRSVPSSDARAINERFDRILRDGSGRNVRFGLDFSQRHALDVERARAAALGEDARTQSALRGQDVAAATSADNAALQARSSALGTLDSLASRAEANRARSESAQLKALQDAAAAGDKQQETGFKRLNDLVSNMFIDPETGTPDRAEQEAFLEFLQGSDVSADGKSLSELAPDEQAKLVQDFKLLDRNKARNAAATRGLFNSGSVTNRVALPVDVREATVNDVVNNHLAPIDYLRSNLPFTNRNVVIDSTGQPTLVSDFVDTNGQEDADKLDLIRRRTGKSAQGRSVLRGN